MSASVLSDYRVLVVPGLHNSGPGHWQSRWQSLFPSFERVEQDQWDVPDLPAWSARLDQVRRPGQGGRRKPMLIVAHSFGTLTTVHSLARDARDVAGVLLVAPADPDKFGVADLLPRRPLPCPSMVIGSGNDPWMAAASAARWARHWGSDFINAGELGHINAESGLGDWPLGLETLYFLAEKVQNAQRMADACLRC